MGKYEYCGYCKHLDCDGYYDRWSNSNKKMDKKGMYECKTLGKKVFPEDEPLKHNCFDQVASYNLSSREHEVFGPSKELRERKGQHIVMPYDNYESVGCFITTVVVHILGMNDDNVVLQVLRNFRSEFLQTNPEYNELLLKYDAVGPLIARSIAHDKNNAYEVALDLYRVYIQGAYDYIRRGHPQKALILYKEMTENLMKHYQISYFIPDGMESKINEQESGHGRLVLKPIDKRGC